MKILKRILIIGALFPIILLSKTINLDKDIAEVQLKNNTMNLLVFPFVVHEAKLSSETPEDFHITSKNTSVVIVPTVGMKQQKADLLIWSAAGDAFIVKINGNGKVDQKFTFSSNKVEVSVPLEAKVFETGKVEKDIKKLIKKTVQGKTIPGYKKVDIKRQFLTPDLNMQKEFYYDGGKYRVETWYVSNITSDNLVLDYENFYTNGILAIAFEKRNLNPGQISKMWLIVNKATVAERIKRNLR